MNRRKIVLLFAVAAMSIFAALPAFAFTYLYQCAGNNVKWPNPNITFQVPLSTFPVGSAFYNSVEAARIGWNNYAPGSNWRIHYTWVTSTAGVKGNGVSEIRVVPTSEWTYAGYAAITELVRACTIYYGYYKEADILINPNSVFWDKSTNPLPQDEMQNTTLVLLHEHGHAMGLGHEDDVLATMNSDWPGPSGGPIGTRNDVHPLGDDARGARNAYGTAVTARDVAASAVRLVSPGVSDTIKGPLYTPRNATISFRFTVLNRGTTDETIPVHFFLSPTRNVDPATRYPLGSTTVSLQYARMVTGTATVTIPANAPTGLQYISWVTDPYNGIAEMDEGNNAVALVGATDVDINRIPNACFHATPTSGNAPLTVSFNAGCSSDADGNGLTYEWDFGDGSWTDSGVTTSHTYYLGGYFTVPLTVTDPSGAKSYAYQTIGVACPPGSPWCEEPL